MMVTDASKRVIPFRPGDAKRVGEGCYYLDQIVWLNGERIELGDRVGFASAATPTASGPGGR